jgi:hypothetical protein
MSTKVLANRPKLLALTWLLCSFMVGGVIGALAFKYLGYTMTLALALMVLLPAVMPLAADWRRVVR